MCLFWSFFSLGRPMSVYADFSVYSVVVYSFWTFYFHHVCIWPFVTEHDKTVHTEDDETVCPEGGGGFDESCFKTPCFKMFDKWSQSFRKKDTVCLWNETRPIVTSTENLMSFSVKDKILTLIFLQIIYWKHSFILLKKKSAITTVSVSKQKQPAKNCLFLF